MTLTALEKKLKKLEEPIKNPILKWLILHLPPQPIKNRKMHKHYTDATSILMEELQTNSTDKIACEAITNYLHSVIPFIEEYEKKKSKLTAATPEEVLHFLLDQNHLTQDDIADELGGQSVVSNILNGKRKLTREHIERLSRRFHVSPASFYKSAA